MTLTRSTKYTQEVIELISEFGHATNSQIINAIRQTYPDVSATTIHRVTARLASLGLIAEAPPSADGSMRYDANAAPHDHFMCTNCGGIRDIDVQDKVKPIVNRALGGCKVTGRLVINGSCDKCIKKQGGKK